MLKNKKFLLILRGVIVILMFYFSYLFQYIPVLLLKINIADIKDNLALQVILSTFSSLIVFIILCLIYHKELLNELKTFKKKFLSNLDMGFKCWLTGLLIMIVSNIFLFFALKSGGANNENTVQAMIKALPLIMGVDVCLLAPFNEEIVFRKTFKDVFKNKFLFVFLSFLFFGGAHVISSAETIVDYLYIIPYGALGGAFAYAYSKTDTVFTSMLFHVIHNTLIFIISVLPLILH